MAELIPYSYSDHVITPFLFFYPDTGKFAERISGVLYNGILQSAYSVIHDNRIHPLFSSSYLKTVKTASLLLLFFHMKLLFSGKGLLGLFFSPCVHLQKNKMWENKE